MSESTSTTTSAPPPSEAPAAPPAPESTAPPPQSQPQLSVSDAARLLGKRRAEAAGQQPPAPPTDRKPSQRELAAQAAKPAEAPKPEPAKAKPSSPLDKAFGMNGEAKPSAESAAPMADAIEIDGERYTRAQIAEAMGKAKDYTTKTQQLAEHARTVQQQQEALQQVLPYIQPELARLQQLVEGVQRPDIALLEADPQRYFRELAQFERAREEQGRILNLNQFQGQQNAKELERRVDEANKQLASEFPFWANPEERAQAQNEIVNWALNKAGFVKDELRHLSDARVLKVMMKAAQFDKWLEGSKATPMPIAQPVRGQAPPPPPTERIGVAQQNFEARPSVRTGAALLTARRAGDR